MGGRVAFSLLRPAVIVWTSRVVVSLTERNIWFKATDEVEAITFEGLLRKWRNGRSRELLGQTGFKISEP